jgi:hypothetical protein
MGMSQSQSDTTGSCGCTLRHKVCNRVDDLCLCAQLYGDSMRYKPEDAVVLRAMQDMKQLDDHTGSW